VPALKKTKKNMDIADTKTLWVQIVEKLNQGRDRNGRSLNWEARIEGLGQLDKSERRRQGTPFSDNDVFEALLKSMLSNSTDWRRVERVSAQLPAIFCDFSLSDYAKRDAAYVNGVLLPTLSGLGVGSNTLRNDLKRLVITAKALSDYSSTHGAADRYFDSVIAKANGDLILATALLGTEGSEFKIKGMGIPLAAEAMKNLGYEVAKPDRHICRAVACWGLVSFRDESWRSAGKTQAPKNVRRPEFIATMRAMEELASIIALPPSYVDQAVWLLCAISGCHASNEELMKMKP
jgi:hypothetical protein